MKLIAPAAGTATTTGWTGRLGRRAKVLITSTRATVATTHSAHQIGPLRVNAWVSLVLCVASIGWFVWLRGHSPPQRRPGTPPPADTADEIDAIA